MAVPVTADEGGGSAEDADRFFQTEEGGDSDAGEVLKEHVADGGYDEDDEREATGYEGSDVRVESDAGEEVDKQDVPGLEVE